MEIKIKKMFDECKEKYGSVVYNGTELALTQKPYPDGAVDGDWCFYASAMDKDGNLWHITWDTVPNADEYDDYYNQVEDWDCPADAGMTETGYYLD